MSLKKTILAGLPGPIARGLRHEWRRVRLGAERYGALQRHINASITVNDLPRHTRERGSVWGVCMAKNEEDIIACTVQHMLDQGLAGVIVVDNRSTDATQIELDRLAARDARVHVGTDSEPGFYQGMKTSYLAHLAWRAGADWVIPFDADELWYAPDVSLGEYLAESDLNQIWCDFRNVYPLPEHAEVTVGSTRPLQVDRVASTWMRIAFRSRRWVSVGEGNHALRDSDAIPARGLHMLHLSYRSLAQYTRKADAGVAALQAAGIDESIATHWRLWARLTDDERSRRWSAYLRGEQGDPNGALVRSDRVVLDDPIRWATWDPDRVLGDEQGARHQR